MSVRLKIAQISAACLALICAPHLAVAGPFNGPITAVFSDPVFVGNIVDVNGNLVPYDNTGTGVVSPTPSGIISWGNSGTPSGFIPSLLGFIPGPDLVAVPSEEPFLLGTFVYLNGSSALNSMIFGAKFTIGIAGAEPLVVDVGMVTTENDLSNRMHDADYITFSGLNLTLAAFEGKAVSAFVYAKIVGDPQIFLTDIALFGPADIDNGFVGGTPIPGALPLFATGLGVIGLVVRRRKNKAIAA